MPDPEAIPEADYIVIESTYGNRVHETGDTTELLGAVIERTVQRGGTIVIPAFAVGRAQSLLYHLWKLKTAGRLSNIPIYLDSPMAIDATELLHAHPCVTPHTEVCARSRNRVLHERLEVPMPITAIRNPKS